MVVRDKGYVNSEVVRKAAGSGTAAYYVFTRQSDALLVDNLGSNGGYVNFDALASTGSGSMYVPAFQARSLDLQAGSVSILGSGGTTPLFQVINLNSTT